MKIYLFIGLGGIIGAISRYSISLLFMQQSGEFPYITLSINLIGCFFLTFLLNNERIKAMITFDILLALTVGLIGSFTTFSAITIETVTLWHENSLLAIIYVCSSVIGGILLCYAGYKSAIRK